MTSRTNVSVPITLSESDGVRYLHFGSPWIQGAMDLRKPERLVLDYIQRMMGWLLFLEPPRRLLQLGLGAGSLSRFCLRHCPDTELTAVEISHDVIQTAFDWFGLADDEPRLRVVRSDALSFLQRASSTRRFGVIQVDLYDMHAHGPAEDSLAFYKACHNALAEPGICVINLFGEHRSFGRNLERIQRAFGGRVLALDPIAEGNRVVFAFKGPSLQIEWDRVVERAATIARRHRLPAGDWVRELRKSSPRSSVLAV